MPIIMLTARDAIPDRIASLDSREQILEAIWGEANVETNAIEVYIRRLREKLEAGAERRLFQTIRGAVYALREV
jgi:DNA-binding response OmpR family regulator